MKRVNIKIKALFVRILTVLASKAGFAAFTLLWYWLFMFIDVPLINAVIVTVAVSAGLIAYRIFTGRKIALRMKDGKINIINIFSMEKKNGVYIIETENEVAFSVGAAFDDDGTRGIAFLMEGDGWNPFRRERVAILSRGEAEMLLAALGQLVSEM